MPTSAQLLQTRGARAGAAGALVSFNGKSFDAPLLETRYLFHRLEWPGSRLPHVDVLHPARRFWGDECAGRRRRARSWRSSSRCSGRGGGATCPASRFPRATSSSSARAMPGRSRRARAQSPRSAVAGGADRATCSTWWRGARGGARTRARRWRSGASTRGRASTSARATRSSARSRCAHRAETSDRQRCGRWRSCAPGGALRRGGGVLARAARDPGDVRRTCRARSQRGARHPSRASGPRSGGGAGVCVAEPGRRRVPGTDARRSIAWDQAGTASVGRGSKRKMSSEPRPSVSFLRPWQPSCGSPTSARRTSS